VLFIHLLSAAGQGTPSAWRPSKASLRRSLSRLASPNLWAQRHVDAPTEDTFRRRSFWWPPRGTQVRTSWRRHRSRHSGLQWLRRCANGLRRGSVEFRLPGESYPARRCIVVVRFTDMLPAIKLACGGLTNWASDLIGYSRTLVWAFRAILGQFLCLQPCSPWLILCRRTALTLATYSWPSASCLDSPMCSFFRRSCANTWRWYWREFVVSRWIPPAEPWRAWHCRRGRASHPITRIDSASVA